jgi:hypothetical protein
MEQGTYRVVAADGHPHIGSNQRRGVAFLVCDEDKRITAKKDFDKLPKDAKKKINTGMDYWLKGYSNRPQLFHGWNQSEFGGKYVFCFVFKSQDGKQSHRLYGFLCNPSTKFPRFQLCVLIFHEYKDGNKTDPTVLKRVDSFRIDPDVNHAIDFYIKSISKEFEEKK